MFRVQVAGLVKATQHNGRFGTVVCELESGRLRVILDGDGQELSLKRCNIEPIGGPTPQQRRLTEEIDALVDDRNWQGLVKMAQEAHAVVCAVRGPFPQIAAQILIKLGKAHQSLREFDQAIEVLSQAQSISAQVGHRAGVADACSALASCFGVMGDGNSAIAYSRKHREMAEMLGDVQGESRACNNLGVHCANAGRHAEAIEPFQRAIDIAEQREHDQAAESRLRLCLGDCYAKQGQIEDAKGQQNRALKIAIQCGDAECAGTACINIGHCFQAQTRYAVAVELYEQGLCFARQVEGFAGLEMQGAAWNNLGACFQALGLYERAMMSHQKAQNMASQVQNKEQERNACANMGRCCMALRLYDAALVQLQKASDISKLSLDHASTGHLCVELGECYRLMSQEDKAHRVLSEARRIATARHDAAADGAACAGLGKCFISQRNYAEAISVLEEALSIAKGSDGTKQPTREGSARNNLGVALKLSGDFEGAACAFGHAISMLQRVEHVAGEDDAWRVSIFEEQQLAYRNLQGVLLGVGGDPAAGDSSSHHNEMGLEKLSARRRWALGVAEQSKARALVHRLRGVGGGGGHDRNTGRDNDAGSTDAEATEGKKLTYEAMCEVWWAEVQTLAREECDGTCVVEYSFVSQDQLAIWVVSSGGELLAQEISRCKVSTATSNADAVGVRGAMGQLLKDLRDNMEVEGRAAVASAQMGGGSLPTDDADLPPSKRGKNCRTCGQRLDQCTCPTLREQREVKVSVQLQKLYRLLIEPVDQHLAGAEELLIIPHQELFEVPWAALTDADGRYLIERHVLRVAPSLRVARMVARDSMQPTQLHAVNPHAVIVGNPQPIPAAFASLPLAEKEAQQICETLEHAVAGLQVLHFANSEATKAAVRQALQGAVWAHAACHGDMETDSLVLAAATGDDVATALVDEKRKRLELELLELEGQVQGPTAIEGDKEGQCDAPRISFEEDVCRHFAKQELEQELAELTNLSMGELLDSQDTKELLDSQDTKCVQLGPGATVVLSACNTGRGVVRAEGVVGLARGFLAAGAAAAVVSLWRVDDASTAALFACMYGHLVQGVSVPRALRLAMLSLACRGTSQHGSKTDVAGDHHPEWKGPMHWAGFQVVGASTHLPLVP